MNASAEPAISPLARRLAEENNVDWRALAGSSAGGAVNERDVLDYLEAVMLGNRPLDPTPEPLPQGLSAWPEEASARAAQTPRAAPMPAAAEAARPPTPTPARTFEPEYRAAQADLEALRGRVAELEAEVARARAERLELGRLREGARGREAALAETAAKVTAFEPQVAELQEALARAQGETRKAQEHGFELAARLNRLNDAQSKAEAENRRLKDAHAGLEQAHAALQNRPWWRFWG